MEVNIFSPTSGKPIPQNVEYADDINNCDGSSHEVKDESKLHRSIWRFLTLGIPLLIKTISVFCDGLTHREKLGMRLRFDYRTDRLTADKIDKSLRYQNFGMSYTTALSRPAEELVWRKINKTISAKKIASKQNDLMQVKAYQDKLDLLESLIKKNNNLKMRRVNFSEQEWQIIDEIQFEIIQNHFDLTVELLNSPWFTNRSNYKTFKKYCNVDYYEAKIAQALAFSLAYTEGLDGKEINIPVFNKKTRCFESVPYIITANRIGDALPCYVLESKNGNARPWITIRGTQSYTKLFASGKEMRQGSFESLMTDFLDPECIVRNVLNKALTKRPIFQIGKVHVQRESIGDIFGRWATQNQQVKICGHSLGGAIANALGVEYYDQIEKTYAFSPPGASEAVGKKWDLLVDKYDLIRNQKRIKLINIDHEGCIVPSGGRRLIGLHLAVKPLEEYKNNSLVAVHNRRHLGRPFDMWKVDIEKENKKFERICCEFLRIIVGKIFSILFSLYSGKYLPDWWKNRKFYQYNAKFYRDMRPLLFVAPT